MAGIAHRALTLYVALTFSSVPLIGLAMGDGGVFGKYGSVFQLEQNSQIAVINHESGYQKMIISINFDWEESTNTAWIFPIPAAPEHVSVDLAGGVPTIGGEDVIQEAKEDIGGSFWAFGLSYLESVFLPLPLGLAINSFFYDLAPGTASLDVHVRLEKYGMMLQVITATDGATIYNYLADNDLEITQGLIPQLDNYVGRNYSFVVTWISGTQVYVREPGVIVGFPTKEAYYPLMLTSVYGNNVIPMGIVVKGHVSPRVYDDIEPHTVVKYMRGKDYISMIDATPEVEDFADGMEEGWDGTFTTINITAPSSAFTEDLWIEKKTPQKVKNAEAIDSLFGERHTLALAFALTLTVAPLLSFAVGFGLLGLKWEYLTIFSFMAIMNILGLLGLILGAIILNAYFNIPGKKAVAYALLCSLSFVAIVLSIYGACYLIYL